MSFPGAADGPPRLDPDDHIAVPEAREEYLHGRRIQLSPARPGHGDTHARLDAVVHVCVAGGYIASSDLLTRRSHDTDFATDACVRKAGIDPATGHRFLEELSFEVFHTQSRRHADARARDVIAGGVRRLFGLFVDSPSPEHEAARRLSISVEEWITDTGSWRPCDPKGYIRDRCLVSPLPVASLLGALDFDAAALRALINKRHPLIAQLKRANQAKGEQRGRAEGLRASLLMLLEHRGLTLDPSQRARLDDCDDFDQLTRWYRRALTVADTVDLFD